MCDTLTMFPIQLRLPYKRKNLILILRFILLISINLIIMRQGRDGGTGGALRHVAHQFFGC